jgi:hypothetical protein
MRAQNAKKWQTFFLCFICFTLSISTWRQAQAQSVGAALKNQQTRHLSHITMPIQIEKSIFAELPVAKRNELQATVCSTLGNTLVVGNGPWGIGFVEKPPTCTIVEKASPVKGHAVWTVMITSAPEGLQAQVCRSLTPTQLGAESCFATLQVPVKKDAAIVLSHPYFAKALVAALSDQLPFQSKASVHLIQEKPNGQKYFIPQKAPPLAPNVKIPDLKVRFIPFDVHLIPETGFFRAGLMNHDAAASRLSVSDFWLVNPRGRNTMRASHRRALLKIHKELMDQGLNHLSGGKTSENILGRNARSESKKDRSFFQRTEGEASIRGGYFNGFKTLQPNVSYGGSLDAAIYMAPWLNFWVDGSYTQSVYKAAARTKSSENSNEESNATSTFTNLRLGIGVGVRKTFSNDLTFFAYPRLSKMALSWIFSEKDNFRTLGAEADVKYDVFPLYGIGIGFRSPETWFMNAQMTLGYDSFLSKNYRGIYCDTELMYELPSQVAVFTSLGIFDRSWFSLFNRIQLHTFSTINSYKSESVLNIFEVVAGFGYRLEFL